MGLHKVSCAVLRSAVFLALDVDEKKQIVGKFCFPFQILEKLHTFSIMKDYVQAEKEISIEKLPRGAVEPIGKSNF